MSALQDFKSLQDRVQAALVATTRKVNLVASQDIAFRRSLDPDTGEQLDEHRTKLLHLAGALVKTAADLSHSKSDVKVPSLEDADDVENHWRTIVDALDVALEKADTCIDEYSGLVKRKDAPAQDMSHGPQSKKPKTGPLDRSLRFANILKPQKAFSVQPNNYEELPWKPILTKKPHAVVPLEESLGSFVDGNGDSQYDYLFNLSFLVAPLSEEDSKLPKRRKALHQRIKRLRRAGSTRDANGNPRYKNPYETEILRMTYPEHVYQTNEPIPFTPIEKSAPIYVDSFEEVLKMLEELKKAREIAIDLEHHDFRTYGGLLSLMQISTRDRDWIVDTLKPWRRRLEILNEVFADPRILKVFHGAYMDIKWLQRDLGLYVVGLFDTFSAAEALHYPGKGLAYLLKKFADFEADKRYQMADWRVRPLPEEMLYYARSDTHYLLYVYDMMRNELVKQSVRGDPARDLIEITLQNSKSTALSRYEGISINHDTGHGSRGWLNGLHRLPSRFTREQFSVYRALHRWRDDLARQQDESPFFIMSQAVLTDISSAMPSNAADLGKLLQHVPHAVRAASGGILALVRDAVERGANGPSVLEVLKADAEDGSAGLVDTSLKGVASAGNNSVVVARDEGLPSAVEVKAKESQLWGNVPMSTIWDKVTLTHRAANNQPMAIPWSSFVANAHVSTEDTAEAMEVDDAVDGAEDDGGVALGNDQGETPPRKIQAPEADVEFTLRTGRAAAAAPLAHDSSTSSESDSDGEGVGLEEKKGAPEALNQSARQETCKEEKRRLKQKRKEEKAARRAEKKALREEKVARRVEKKALKEQKMKASSAEGTGAEDGPPEVEEPQGMAAGGEDEPFDYTKAPSVLHGQPPKGSGNGGGAKAYNPYVAKTTAEGPKPARRMNFEKAGKSATFKK